MWGGHNFIDITNNKYGRLTVIREKPISEYPSGKRNGVSWYCNCECGTTNFVAKGVDLRRGHVKSCGCLNSEMSVKKNTKDLSGQRFGLLTVIKLSNDDSVKKTRGSYWECICDCGTRTVIRGNALKTGGTMSCGCLNSKAELKIREILNSNNIKYKSQYWFDDLRSKHTNYLLRFDFAIFKDNKLLYIIEYDGQQHECGTRFSNDEEKNKLKFERTKEYDIQKNKYCKEHNIELIRISYKDFDKIDAIVQEIIRKKE